MMRPAKGAQLRTRAEIMEKPSMEEKPDSPTAGFQEYSGERDMDRFWREVAPRKEPLQKRWYLPSIILLAIVSVPWYLPPGFVGRLYGGLPIWVWTTLFCSLCIAGVTSYVALRAWHDDED